MRRRTHVRRHIRHNRSGPTDVREHTRGMQARALKTRQLLEDIDTKITELEQVDPYGDISENFKDEDKETRHTRRIIKMLDDDIKRGKFRNFDRTGKWEWER